MLVFACGVGLRCSSRSRCWLPRPLSVAGAAGDFPPVDQPGVTDTEIHVGGVLTDTMNPTGVSYGPAFDGVEAYFEYINKTEGGVYGRKLVLVLEA